MFRFFVPGRPMPQGSKTAFVRHGKAVMIESCKGLPAWRRAVTLAAQAAIPPGWDSDARCYALDVAFYFARPKYHARMSHPPSEHATRPDASKLVRAIEDSLTDAAVWLDDARVAALQARKLYVTTQKSPASQGGSEAGEIEGALVIVRVLG